MVLDNILVPVKPPPASAKLEVVLRRGTRGRRLPAASPPRELLTSPVWSKRGGGGEKLPWTWKRAEERESYSHKCEKNTIFLLLIAISTSPWLGKCQYNKNLLFRT